MLSSVLLPFNKPALASKPSSHSTLSLKPLSFVSMMKGTDGNAGDTGSIPVWGRSSGKGNGNPLQYSYLGNPMDRGTWWATVYEVAKRVGHDLATEQEEEY